MLTLLDHVNSRLSTESFVFVVLFLSFVTRVTFVSHCLGNIHLSDDLFAAMNIVIQIKQRHLCE
jgi:hypothetical protein